jgi:hypothetical protein
VPASDRVAQTEVDEVNIEADSRFAHDGLCEWIADLYNERGYKAEWDGKTTVRVYGGVFKDHFHPVIKGEVTSPDLKPNELPKVTNPKRL